MKFGKFLGLLALAAAVSCAGHAQAALHINELFVSPEDGADGDEGDGREFFELLSDTPGESLAGVYLLEVVGLDFERGVVTQAVNIGAAASATGTNGLFLWRDADIDLVPLRDPATTYAFGDFAGDEGMAEFDNLSYLLVRNFTGAIGDDLDTVGGPEDLDGPFTDDGDGIFDTTPWTEVIDAVGYTEAGEPGISYAGSYGGTELLNLPFGPDAFVRLGGLGPWFAFDSPLGEGEPSFVGPFTADGFDENDNFLHGAGQQAPGVAANFYLSPGNLNPSLVPEPSSLALALASAFGLGVVRRRK
jgi:hypothetical protein